MRPSALSKSIGGGHHQRWALLKAWCCFLGQVHGHYFTWSPTTLLSISWEWLGYALCTFNVVSMQQCYRCTCNCSVSFSSMHLPRIRFSWLQHNLTHCMMLANLASKTYASHEGSIRCMLMHDGVAADSHQDQEVCLFHCKAIALRTNKSKLPKQHIRPLLRQYQHWPARGQSLMKFLCNLGAFPHF